MQIEQMILNEERNVSLTSYIQDVGGEYAYVSKRPAILVVPGGGYQMCSDREAEPVALAYAKAGFQAFVLRYSIKENAKWPQPLVDYELAMEIIQGNSEKWKLDPDRVAAIGFSAGGHLVGCAATMAKNRPNAVILGYPVLIGEDAQKCNDTAPDVISAVSRDTAPSFVFASRRDNVVPIVNATRYIQALAEHDVAFESHIYAYGPHGFSLADTAIQSPDTIMCKRIPEWVDDSVMWLKETLGDYSQNGFTKPIYRKHMTDDEEEYYSIYCSLPYLMMNEKTKNIVNARVQQMASFIGAHEVTSQSLSQSLGIMTMFDLMTIMQESEHEIIDIDIQLRKINKK